MMRMFNKVLNENQNTLTLNQLKEQLSREYDGSTVINLMRRYCLQASSKNILKTGMEFLYMNGFYDDLQVLIKKNMESGSPSNKQWALIYQIIIDRRLNHYTPHELLQSISKINTAEPELLCLIEFVKVTAYYDLKQYSKIGNFLEMHQQLLNEVGDKLLVSFFKIRLYQIMMTYYLTRNEIIMARKYGFRVLSRTESKRTKAGTHIKLGLSYTFNSYEQGMYHLTEALQIAEENKLNNIAYIIKNHNIPFLSAHFNNVESISTDDKSEQAHIEIAKGNDQKAIEILNQLSLDSPFQLYYLGIATKDKDILIQSYNYFIQKRSDYFFSRLPRKALKELGRY